MPEAKDTLLRLLSMLRLVPAYPRYVSTSTLKEKLQDRGFSVDLRTVQRDLKQLSTIFSLIEVREGGRIQWSQSKDTPLDLRDMEPATALALYLAEGHLKALLPQSVLDLLSPQFNKARNYLGEVDGNQLAHWARSVSAVPNGRALLPAAVDSVVWREVSNALLTRKQLQLTYLSRSKTDSKQLLVNPAGLVSRHSISYLIGNVAGYEDLRQFALHRIQMARCEDTDATLQSGFDINHYIKQGGLNSAGPVEQIVLVADVSPQIAWLLNETPLSEDQTLEPLADGSWHRLRVTVADDQETRWWAFALADNIRVHQPAAWIEEFASKARGMLSLYE